MKKILLFFLSALLLVACGGGSTSKTNGKRTFKVLQFNIWQEGTKAPGGYEAIIDQIIASDADFVTLSEVRNYKNTRFCDRIVQSLKERGQQYYSFYSYDSGLLSRYPITDSLTVYPCIDDHGSAYRAVINMEGQEVALYTTHLDYLNCTYYDIRGYSGCTREKRPPLLDIDSILADNVASRRDDGMQAILNYAKEDRQKNRIVLIGGDFNEPSHLDWIESTKDMFDHRGLIIPWTVSKMLEKEGYTDTYREMYRNPVTHPGVTFPSDNELIDVKTLTWTPDSDERERIDFIYYAPFGQLKVKDAVIWGPDKSIAYSKRVKEETQDKFKMAEGVWPTDHKALLVTFEW